MELFTNFSKSLLAAPITNVATTLNVTPGTGALFPAPTAPDFSRLVLFEYGAAGETNQEIVLLTARAVDAFTITRAQEGTTAKAYPAGASVALRPTAEMLTNMRPETLHVKRTVVFETEFDAGAGGAAKTINFANYQKQKINKLDTASCTITFSALSAVQVGHYQLRLIQDATGGRNVVIAGVPSGNYLNSSVQPDINTLPNGQTIINLFWTGAEFIVSVNLVGV